MSTKQLLTLFIPIVLLASFALFVNVSKYEPQFPDIEPTEQVEDFSIPILPSDPIIGQRNAPKTLIAFEDLACEGCKIATSQLKQLQQEYPGQFKVIWKALPIVRYPYDSRLAIQYAYCANEQDKFNDFETIAYVNFDNLSQPVLDSIRATIKVDEGDFERCLQSPVADETIRLNEAIAEQLNLQSVPTFFLNNEQIQTPRDLAGWKQVLSLE